MQQWQVLCALFEALAAEESLFCDATVVLERATLEEHRGLLLRESNAVAFNFSHGAQTHSSLVLRLDSCVSIDGETVYIPHPRSIALQPVEHMGVLPSPQIVEFEAIPDAAEWSAASAAMIALALLALTQFAMALLRRFLAQQTFAPREALLEPQPVLLLLTDGSEASDNEDDERQKEAELASDHATEEEEPLSVPIPETEEEWRQLFERVYDGDCVDVVPSA